MPKSLAKVAQVPWTYFPLYKFSSCHENDPDIFHKSILPTGSKESVFMQRTIEKDTETSQQPERKAHQSGLHQFFIKKSSAATKESMCQDAQSAASSSTHEEVWTVKQQAMKI